MVPENSSWREAFIDTVPLAKGTNFAISSQCATRVFSTQSANKSIVFLYENELNVSGMSSSVTSNLVNCTVEWLACREPKEIIESFGVVFRGPFKIRTIEHVSGTTCPQNERLGRRHSLPKR
jgi:hypothetical protein